MTTRICIAVSAGEFVAELGTGSDRVEVALVAPRLASDLADIAILLTVTDGTVTAKLRRHLEEHFQRGTAPSGACEFCKLQGRVLAGQGRRRLGDEEHQRRVIPAQVAKSEARRIALGVTRQGQDRAARSAAERERARLARQPRLGLGKGVRGDELEGLF